MYFSGVASCSDVTLTFNYCNEGEVTFLQFIYQQTGNRQTVYCPLRVCCFGVQILIIYYLRL